MKKYSIPFLLAILLLTLGCFYFFSGSLSFGIISNKNVVLIDKSLQNYQQLAAISKSNFSVILVENDETGFARMQEKIEALHGVESLHILTHGTSGNFVLGKQQLNEKNLDKFQGFWKSVRKSFASERSELLIYSCQLANGTDGKSFVNSLNKFLGVSVAGSDDNTGSQKRGGDWNLEYAVGNIVKDHILKYLDFQGLLVPKFSEFSGASSPFDALKIFTDDQLIYGDFDSDGDIDIHLYPNGSSLVNEFWQNNGSGIFTKVADNAGPFRNVTERAAFYSASSAFVADWDNDGDVDILAGSRGSLGTNVFYKNNNGTYQEITGTNSPFYGIPISGSTELIFGDFDADGDVDINTYPGSSLPNEFWRNDGAGHFSKVTDATNPFRNIANNAVSSAVSYAHVADWDNDGDDDIFVSRLIVTAGVKAYYRNDGGTYVTLTGASNPFNDMVIDTDNQFIYGDFDADGDVDIQASDGSSTLVFWQNNGFGVFTNVTGTNNPFNNLANAGTFYNNSQKAFVADWDNDKDVDVFVTNRTASDQNILFRQSDAPPVLTSSNPSNAATVVAVTSNIVLNFNIGMTPVAGKNIIIKRTSNDAIVATIPASGALVTGVGTASITVNPTLDLDPTTSFYIVIDKGAFKDTEGRIYEGISSKTQLAFTTAAPLPVTLVNFDVRKEESGVLLSWITSSETNSSHFEIQQSKKGGDWKSLGVVEALTESSAIHKYQFADPNPVAGENLYRLKMIDLDATFTYSRIRSVVFDQPALIITPYPNPVTEKLFLMASNLNDIKQLAIYNTTGALVYQSGSYNTKGIQVSNLPMGLYVLKLTTSQNQSSTHKFSKN